MKNFILVLILFLTGICAGAKECTTGYACSIEELNKKNSVRKEQPVKKVTAKNVSKEKIKNSPRKFRNKRNF